MKGSRLRAARVLLWAVMGAGLGLADFGAAPALAGVTAGQVELDCRIAAHRLRTDPWVIEVRRPDGTPARIVTTFANSTVHFTKLEAGIYSVCVIGMENRQSCESVDLNPPPGKKSFRLIKKFAAPAHALNMSDAHRISRRELAVPDKARVELKRAEDFQLRGDSDQAVRHLNRAIQIYPDYTDALNNLGTYYHRKGKFGEAIDYFRKVTELAPDFYGGWVNLAGSLLATGQFQRALAASDRAYTLRPNDSVVISQMALNYYYLHDMSEARRYFLRLLQMDPASALNPQLYLVHIALAQRNKDEAVQYLKEFLAIHPNSPDAAQLRQTLANIDSLNFDLPVDYAHAGR